MKEPPQSIASERETHLLDHVDAISNQLCQAVEGGFDFHVHTDSDEIALQKLAQLNNFMLESVRRTIADLETSREKLESRVEERTQRLNLVLTATNDGVWEWEIDSGDMLLSERWSNMLGLAHEGENQRLEDWLSRIHGDDRSEVERALYRHLDGLTPSVNVEYRIRDGRGAWRMVLCRGLCQRDENGRALRMAGTQTDTTEHRLCDPLTLLPNGTYLEIMLNERLSDRRRAPMALVKFQLLNVASLFDGVAVNDALSALRRLVQGMRRQIPPRIPLVALPEHTFAMIFDSNSQEVLEEALLPLESLLAEPVEIDGQQVWLSHVSGVAALDSNEPITIDEWRHRSRLALANARLSDVGTRRYYSEPLRQWERQNSRAEQLIRGALAGDGVRCFVQPIVDASSGKIQCFEALMRLHDPVDGIINPGAFIDVAERSGLIAPLWELLMEQALPLLKDAAVRERYGETFLLSVNLSTRQLMDPNLLDVLIAASERHGVPYRRLQVEVTETSVLSDPVKAFRSLDRMRAAGISVALDDFGSGYSSLAQLTSMPMDTVKIDRELVMNVTSLPRKRHVLAAVVALCQRLDYRVVVEGVEERDTLDLLREWDVTDIQGYYYAKPLPLERLVADFPLPRPHRRRDSNRSAQASPSTT
ncbi:EAL domain-containing protein [Salinicola rhizosphaerae]|uniref:GGDEF domain-containing protein n=1 Tax=Salinicola rhizosphaerae TaxID=1443141 RepID=A0ABQ3E1K8_9GAMM|nr:EAL domain-containing protein [Salinicola rhizosphaerae]GHB20845.1 GGDEF domain-containing protein [Salinicola rhizosphaerae]